MSEQNSANDVGVKCIERYPNGDVLVELTMPNGDRRRIIMKSRHEKIIRVSETASFGEEDVSPPDYGVRALQ